MIYCLSLKHVVAFHVTLIGPEALLNRVLCPSCLSFQLICLPWFCQAQSCFRQIVTHLSCALVFHCFKSGAKSTLRVMALEGWETLIGVLLGVGHLRPLWQQTGWTPFGGMCWQAPPQLPLPVCPCGNTCLSCGNPVAGSTLHGCWTRSLLFICRCFRRRGSPLMTTPQGSHWVLLVLPFCPNRNPMPQTRQGDHWVFVR